MPLLAVVVTIIVIGVLLWLVNAYVPIDGTVRKILNAVVVIALIVWLLHVFGAWDYIKAVKV
jgi:hypothetical protein